MPLAPPVGIVVANHNNGAFVEKAIESVACQTVGDLRVVVVDDASTDSSDDAIRRWETSGERSASAGRWDATAPQDWIFLEFESVAVTMDAVCPRPPTKNARRFFICHPAE